MCVRLSIDNHRGTSMVASMVAQIEIIAGARVRWRTLCRNNFGGIIFGIISGKKNSGII